MGGIALGFHPGGQGQIASHKLAETVEAGVNYPHLDTGAIIAKGWRCAATPWLTAVGRGVGVGMDACA